MFFFSEWEILNSRWNIKISSMVDIAIPPTVRLFALCRNWSDCKNACCRCESFCSIQTLWDFTINWSTWSTLSHSDNWFHTSRLKVRPLDIPHFQKLQENKQISRKDNWPTRPTHSRPVVITMFTRVVHPSPFSK